MKRKFSFSLPPLKMPSKGDSSNKATPEPTPSQPSAAASLPRRRQSKDDVLNSPFISRRPLDPKTEQELRSACALILQNFKPSDHDLPDEARRIVETSGTRRKDHGSAAVRVHRPTGAPPESDSKKHSNATAKREAPPMRANTGRRRTDHTEQPARPHVQNPAFVIPSATAIRDQMDAEDDTGLNSPITSSTASHMNNASTAPTSAAYTSSRNSNRASRQLENAAAVADAQAVEWMRQEVEKRRQHKASQPQTESQAQVPRRAKSIRSDIKEYIFPSSSSLSRSTSRQLSRRESHETMRSGSSSSKEPKRSGSSQGWRSWGLQRKFSSRSNSRPGTSKGRIESSDHDKRSDLNLNRELPPLPSLDTWKQPEAQKKSEARKSVAQGAHIATLMRPQDQQQQEYAAAVRRHHRRSGSDTLALRYANSSYSQPIPHIARTMSQKQPQLVSVTKRETLKRTTTAPPTVDSTMDFDDMMSRMDAPKNFSAQLELGVKPQSPERDRSADVRSPSRSVKMSSDHSRLATPHAPNFSRKISGDIPSAQRTLYNNSEYQNAVRLEGQQKNSQKSKLKKVFSTWISKKEKKDNWMDQFEKNGVKTGLMIQDEHDAALPPVVRY